MRRSPTSLLAIALLACSAAPAAAGAQLSPARAPASAQASAAPGQASAARPPAARASIRVLSGQPTRRARYVARGAKVRVRGVVRPYAAGQHAALEVLRRGRVVLRKIAPIRRGGRVAAAVRIRRGGLVKVRWRHAATPGLGAFVSRAVRLRAISASAGQGARGTRVVLLQRALRDLGFAVPVTGYYNLGTSRAVLAYRKTNGLGRSGYATRRVFARALSGRGAFRPRYPRAGRHVEFDWSRQVLALVRGGRARRVYHASSGKASTPTVFGSFRFYRKDYGTNGLGMVHASYFIGGYAIHGYHSVPNYPASHGCIRVPIPNALGIFNAISHGQRIFVYR